MGYVRDKIKREKIERAARYAKFAAAWAEAVEKGNAAQQIINNAIAPARGGKVQMDMDKEKAYQARELNRWNDEKRGRGGCYYDGPEDFSSSLEGGEAWVQGQIEHIESGNYGDGACLALQVVMQGLSASTNDVARVGSFVLTALYGCEFRGWNKLTPGAQEAANKAVSAWLSADRDYAAELI